MPLEDLVATIEKPKGRIEKHRPLLVHSEALTRYVLIDPLLRELGWDTEDPERVRPEYPDPSGRPDYALIGNDRPISMVEAKSLGTNLDDTVVRRAMEYCTGQGVKYAIVTNGERWELYNVLQSGTFEERRLLMLSIAGESTHQCALQLLLLWRPNLAAGQPISASEPILSGESQSPTRDIEQVTNTPPPVPPSDEGWTSLVTFRHEKGSPAPSTIRLPDGSEKQTKYWISVMIEVAEYLVRKGDLTADKCPIGTGVVQYIVHSQRLHSNGRDFVSSRRLSNGLFLERDWGAVETQLRMTRFLLQHFGEDPESVHLKLG